MQAPAIRVRPLRRACFVVAAVIGIVTAPGARAQGVGSLAGVVLDSGGSPILGARLEVNGTASRTTTDERGEFKLIGLPIGTAKVHARRLGFIPFSIEVPITTVATTGLSIRLTPIPAVLSPVSVRARRIPYTGRLAGYYERLERRGGGQFITRDQIDRENPRMLSHLLQHVPGVTARKIRGGGMGVRLRGRNCWPLVWLDGMPLAAGEVDVDAFTPSSLHGIELYLGSTTAPLRYMHVRNVSSCGTILLWSRGPDTDPVTPVPQTAGHIERLLASLSVFTADQVDRRAELNVGDSLDVSYPPGLFAAGVRGTVIAEFVVDATGRVERGTFGIVSSPHPLFSDAVRQAVERATYRPAIRQGAPVRQLVQQPFDFSLDRRRSPSG